MFKWMQKHWVLAIILAVFLFIPIGLTLLWRLGLIFQGKSPFPDLARVDLSNRRFPAHVGIEPGINTTSADAETPDVES